MWRPHVWKGTWMTAALPHEQTDAPPAIQLSVSAHPGLSGLLTLERDWRQLVHRSRTENGFLAWEWVAEWARTFMGEESLTVVVRTNGRAVAIAPFAIQKEQIAPGLRVKYLQLFGPRRYQHLFEVPEVLVEPAWSRQAFTALIDHVMRAGDWDWIELYASGDGIAPLNSALKALDFDSVVETRDLTPVMALDPDWDRIRGRLRRNVKESIRRAYNSFKRQGINYTFRQVAGDEACGVYLQSFFALHRDRARFARGRRHADYFRAPRLEQFATSALRSMFLSGHAKLAVIEVGGRPVAARVVLEMGRTVFLYLSGFDTRLWANNVPTLLVTEIIKDAAVRGMETVNFSPGVDQSKSRWDVVCVPGVHLSVLNAHATAGSRLRALLIKRYLWDGARSVLRRSGAPPIQMLWNRKSAGW